MRKRDVKKDMLAKENGYVMIRLDCNESDMIYIKTSILSSKLNELFDFSYVDWEQCHKDALSSKVKEVCDYWNQLENPSVNKVFAELKLPRSTVQRWLKKGALAGMCNYDPFEERIKSNKYSKHKIYKKVVCLNTHTVYDSITKASEYYNITSGSISNACKGKISFAGRDSNTKEPLLWMYYKDYQKMSKSDIDSYIKSKINTRSISPCNTVNYLELKLPPGVTNAIKGDKFIVQFLDGEPNKPVLMRKL